MLRADRTGSSSWAIIYRPDSRRVIERLIALAESGRAICLKDNHEQMGARTAFFGETDLWFGNGGEETLRSQDSRPSRHAPDELKTRWRHRAGPPTRFDNNDSPCS